MRKSARDENKIEASSGNVFADLGFDDAEAQVLALRADLMAQVEKTIKARKMTQIAAAKLLGVTQSRVSDLKRGKVKLEVALAKGKTGVDKRDALREKDLDREAARDLRER